MSNRKPLLSFSFQAQRDLHAIQHYTYRKWGENQFNTYKQRLDEAFQKIQNIPTIGARSQDVSPKYRVYKVQKHRIIYHLTDEEIRIMRVLHDERIVPRYLT